MFNWASKVSGGIFLILLLSSITNALTFKATALVIAVDYDNADLGRYVFDGYGIPYEILEVPHTNIALPTLESSSGGNYGLFVMVSEAMVNGTSSLSDEQWESLWSYQRKYAVRMVHINVSPGVAYGTQLASAGGCCDALVEQNITLVESVATKEFPNAGLKCVFHFLVIFILSTNEHWVELLIWALLGFTIIQPRY